MESEKFLLKANDEEGCDVISSLLQDSIFHITSHSFHDDKKCLRLLLNRFCWELLTAEEQDNYAPQEGKDICYYRVHSGLYIHNVKNIFINHSFKDGKHARYLNLLAMHATPHEINLLFSGHRNVCVEVDQLNVYLKDLHDKYPTPTRSMHNI